VEAGCVHAQTRTLSFFLVVKVQAAQIRLWFGPPQDELGRPPEVEPRHERLVRLHERVHQIVVSVQGEVREPDTNASRQAEDGRQVH
jgi:hypothetical protein